METTTARVSWGMATEYVRAGTVTLFLLYGIGWF